MIKKVSIWPFLRILESIMVNFGRFRNWKFEKVGDLFEGIKLVFQVFTKSIGLFL